MQNTEALYLPDTNLDIRKVFQELLFFDRINFYQAAENKEPVTDNKWNKMCPGYAPLPFGPELERFKKLIGELKGHEQEFYNAQLSGMSLESPEYRNEKTVREIISSVSGRKNRTGEPDGRDDLWHHRLLLKLAEIRRSEEEELNRELAEISDKEAALYDSLKGAPEFNLHLSGAPARSGGITELTDTILKAWGRLFLNDDYYSHKVLLTADKDTAESLFEAHNALSGGRLPGRICRLTLPLSGGLDEEAWFKFRGEFREKAKNVLAGFNDLFSGITKSGKKENTLQKSTVLAAEWGSLLEEFSSGARPTAAASCDLKNANPPHLEIYLCEYSLAALVARHCRLNPASAYTGGDYGLIALKTSSPITCTD